MEHELSQIRLSEIDWHPDNALPDGYHFNDYRLSLDTLRSQNTGALRINLESPTTVPIQIRIGSNTENSASVPTNLTNRFIGPRSVCKESPDYEKFLTIASRHMYEPEKLGNVPALMHKYDCKIKSNADVISRVNQVLALTQDNYNYVILPKDVEAATEAASGKFGGIGVRLRSADLDKSGNEVTPFKSSSPVLTAFDKYPINLKDHKGIVVDEVFKDTPAERGGLKKGDIILNVGTKKVSDMDAAAVSDLIRGEKGTLVDLQIAHNGDKADLKLRRDLVDVPNVSEPQDMGNGIYHIRILSFLRSDTGEELRAAMEKVPQAKGFAIDVRDNHGGIIDASLRSAELFIDKGTLMTERLRLDSPPEKPIYEQARFDLDADNMLITNHKPDSDDTVDKNDRLPFVAAGRPIVVITNDVSASASEIFTGAVHDTGHVTTLGTKTFGKGIGQTSYQNMPGGTNLKVTMLHYETPSGLWPGDADKHRIGIKPDIVVENPLGAVIGSPQDKQLSAAVSVLKNQIAGQKLGKHPSQQQRS